MADFLENAFQFVLTNVSTATYGTLSRLDFSAKPVVQTAVIVNGTLGGINPVRTHQLQLLVRDTDVATSLARAQTLHALFNDTWVTTHGLSGHFVADHGVGPWYRDEVGMPVHTLNYRFNTVSRSL